MGFQLPVPQLVLLTPEISGWTIQPVGPGPFRPMAATRLHLHLQRSIGPVELLSTHPRWLGCGYQRYVPLRWNEQQKHLKIGCLPPKWKDQFPNKIHRLLLVLGKSYLFFLLKEKLCSQTHLINTAFSNFHRIPSFCTHVFSSLKCSSHRTSAKILGSNTQIPQRHVTPKITSIQELLCTYKLEWICIKMPIKYEHHYTNLCQCTLNPITICSNLWVHTKQLAGEVSVKLIEDILFRSKTENTSLWRHPISVPQQKTTATKRTLWNDYLSTKST